jgi:hypothetical protein
MSDDNVFSFSRCPISAVPPLPRAHLLTNPTINDAPPDIPDCPENPVPPLTPDSPCPVFVPPSSKITVGAESAAIRFQILEGGCCNFFTELQIDIPDFCPTITPEGTTTKPIAYASPAQIVYGLVKTNDDDCAFDFNIDVQIPCPGFTPVGEQTKAVAFSESPKLTYQISKTDDCDFDLDINVSAPCPTIGPDDGENSVEFSDDPQVSFGFTPSGLCGFDLDVQVGVPCVSMTPTTDTHITVTVDREDPKLRYHFQKEESSGTCNWSLVVDELSVPGSGSAVYPGSLTADYVGTACDSLVSVQVDALDSTVEARLVLRNCCADSVMLIEGQRVWVTEVPQIDDSSEWQIISIEGIAVAPIELTADISGSTGTAKFSIGSSSLTFDVHDSHGIYPNAKSGYKGYAACSDIGGGQWELLSMEQLPLFIKGSLYANLATTDATGTGIVSDYSRGHDPDPTSMHVTLNNDMKFEGKTGNLFHAWLNRAGVYQLNQLLTDCSDGG